MAITTIPSSGIASGVLAPKIANVQVANSSWSTLDDTAVSVDGGYVIINGSNFVTGCTVVIGQTTASAVSFVSSTQLRVTVPAQSAGTYTAYVVNPDGGAGIGVSAITYSSFPSWVTASTLANTSTNTAYSYQLSATGATSYSLQAGSSLPANSTLASNGLFSGNTNVASNTAYSFTVEATDAENQNSPRTFSLNINSTMEEPYWANTVILLNFENNLTNESSSGITMIQGSTPIPFRSFDWNPSVPYQYVKYGSYAAGYMSTSAGARTSSTIDFSTNNWTIEGWFYPTENSSGVGQAWSQGINTSNGLLGGVHQGGVFFRSSGQTDLSASISLSGRWSHIAWVRSGNTVYIFVDGVQQATKTYTNSMTDSSWTFSVGPNSSYTGANEAFNFAGFIDSFRITLGVARYSSNFTPPSSAYSQYLN